MISKSILKRKLNTKLFIGVLSKTIWYIVIFGLCFQILFPIFTKTMQSFMAVEDLTDPTVKLYPKHFDVYFFRRAMDLMEYWRSALNTLIVSLTVSVLQMLICTIVGYGFARFNFKGKGIIFAGVLLTLLIPPHLYSTSLYLYFRYFGLPFLPKINAIDTPLSYIVLSLTATGLKNGLYIYLMRQFFKGMPKELEESAYIDGYGVFGTFFKIMLPNASNMIITILVLSFAWQWTDVFYTSILNYQNTTLSSSLLRHIVNIAADGSRLDPIQFYVLRNTGCLLIIIPLIIIYAVAQKRLSEGIERSGIVG